MGANLGLGMTFRFVTFGVIFLLSTLCAAKSTCSPSETFDQPSKATHDFPRILRNAQSGNPDAQFIVGITYETGCGIGQDYTEAARWYRKAADAGHPGAQNNLGGLYLQGLGMEQSDAEALKWYLRAALEGHPAAQNNIGYMYETGRLAPNTSGTQNGDEAVKWYRRAAKAGYAAAELNLGLAFFHGTGVRQDLPEAVRWFLKAAGHSSAAACDQLGVVYQHGWGVPQDYSVAARWYRLADERGFSQAKRDLSTLDELVRQATSEVSSNRTGH